MFGQHTPPLIHRLHRIAWRGWSLMGRHHHHSIQSLSYRTTRRPSRWSLMGRHHHHSIGGRHKCINAV